MSNVKCTNARLSEENTMGMRHAGMRKERKEKGKGNREARTVSPPLFGCEIREGVVVVRCMWMMEVIVVRMV